jgi:hypothetical protein
MLLDFEAFLNGKIAVKEVDEPEYDILLQELEKEGYLWGGGEKPTEYRPLWGYCLHIPIGNGYDGDKIYHDSEAYLESKNIAIMTPSELWTNDVSKKVSFDDFEDIIGETI